MKSTPLLFLFTGAALFWAQYMQAEEQSGLTLQVPAPFVGELRAELGQGRINLPVRGDDTFVLPDETRKDLDRILHSIVRTNPRFQSGIVDLSDGRRLTVGRQGAEFLVSPTSGVVGGLPPDVPRSVGGPPTVLRVVDEDGEILSTGLPTAGLTAEEDRPSCGANTGDPNSHCALSTVRLLDRDEGLFCTGVVITDRHVLTAAHCLCDRDGSKIHVKFGAGPFFHSLPVSAKIAFFDRGNGTHCAAGQTSQISADNGDLAVLTLADPDPTDQQTPLDLVTEGILVRGEAADQPLDEDEVMRLRAMIGVGDTETWTPNQSFGNGFATWGWGDGPDGVAGTKRGLIYPLAELLTCQGEMVEGECQGLQEAVFQDRDHALCAGDSGGGVFKAAAPEPETSADSLAGYGLWALMGIVSGDIAPANCHNTSGQLLSEHHPRNITRVDTPEVMAWLQTVTDNAVVSSPIRMTYEIIVAGDN